MKSEYALGMAFLLAAAVPASYVLAQPSAATLSYRDVLREARRYEKLEGSERTTSGKVLFQKVRLDLKPFGAGSKDFYVVRRDEVAFVCEKLASGFKGGTVEAMVVRHEEGAEGSHFFTLESCTAVK
jgi:hypothetical protein